jgi:glucose-6-phosphate 1-dehydrogenase
MNNQRDAAADVLVIFGITGDLARRMTFRALYRLERRGLLDCPVMGVASDDITTEQLVKHAREAIVDSGQELEDADFGRLARRISYLHGDVRDAALYRSLAAEIGGRQQPVYYLEVSPSLFGLIVEQLGAVFRAMPTADPQHYVRGQYEGYADVPGAAPGSATETYVALRLEIDNWRWADVPVFLRAGKALPHKVTEVWMFLRREPRLAFLPEPTRAEPNQIVLRIDPDPGLRLQLSALARQSWRPVHLDTSFARELGEPPEPYEVLLHAAMVGDHQYFAREDSVEETWRIVQRLLDHPPDVRPYACGSWGPEGAEAVVRGHPRWQQPWLPTES